MQAIIILAHKNIDQVVKLADLLNEKFKVYIHVDQKIQLTDTQKKVLDEMGVHYFSYVAVNWGGWSIAEAAIRGMKEVVKDPTINYVHVISGQDWPIKDIAEIYDFYEHNNHIYLTYSLSKENIKSGERLVNWQKYYFYYDKINRRSLFGKIFHRFNMMAQKILRVNKLKKYNFKGEIYDGANWCDLPIDVVHYLLDYIEDNPQIMKIFKTGFCPDEFWMQTILVNNEQMKARIINNNHRFIKWQKQHGSYPAILDETDFDEIEKSDAHFGRKFDLQYSQTLIDKLNIK